MLQIKLRLVEQSSSWKAENMVCFYTFGINADMYGISAGRSKRIAPCFSDSRCAHVDKFPWSYNRPKRRARHAGGAALHALKLYGKAAESSALKAAQSMSVRLILAGRATSFASISSCKDGSLMLPFEHRSNRVGLNRSNCTWYQPAFVDPNRCKGIERALYRRQPVIYELCLWSMLRSEKNRQCKLIHERVLAKGTDGKSPVACQRLARATLS